MGEDFGHPTRGRKWISIFIIKDSLNVLLSDVEKLDILTKEIPTLHACFEYEGVSREEDIECKNIQRPSGERVKCRLSHYLFRKGTG